MGEFAGGLYLAVENVCDTCAFAAGEPCHDKGVGGLDERGDSMVDFFMLVVLTGAGDDLQGIKIGIMELADAFVVNKDRKSVAKK